MFIPHNGDLALAALANFPATRHGLGYMGRFSAERSNIPVYPTNKLVVEITLQKIEKKECSCFERKTK